LVANGGWGMSNVDGSRGGNVSWSGRSDGDGASENYETEHFSGGFVVAVNATA
jgi:hypothetical protein